MRDGNPTVRAFRALRPIRLCAALLLIGVSAAVAQAQTPAKPVAELKLDTGEDIFKAACIGCHGPQGRGQPQSTLGFEPPDTFPDFTDCNGSTREKMSDWRATIHQGGRGRGFSEIMPSFGEALTLTQIEMVMRYLRTLCAETPWPLGEQNFPRALFTEKAFPEDEWVLSGSASRAGGSSISSTLIYEKRFGVRNQLEFAAPFSFMERAPGSWVGGIGDLVLGYKRVVMHNGKSGSILSLQGEVALPTGNRTAGLGSGGTVFETFAAFGQALPGYGFLQLQAGAELPKNTTLAPRAAFGRLAAGKTFASNAGLGRSWTPMVEVLADRDLVAGSSVLWDIVPQAQVTLNKRQHVRANVGFRLPLNDRPGRPKEVVFYLLWDWFDGGLRDGW